MVLPRPSRTTSSARRDSHSTADTSAVVALRVATWNLRHGRGLRCGGGVDLGAVTARIAELDADVVAVQEADRFQRRSGGTDQVMEIAERLGWHGLFAATMIGHAEGMRPASPDGVDDGDPAYGVGLLSRHPLAAATAVVLSAADFTAPGGGAGADNEPRVVLQAAVPTVAGEVGITTTHLSWLPWKAWRQARLVLELAAARPGPAVVAGDLNLPSAWVRAALRDTGWHVACAGATFPGRSPVVQLDHVLVRGGRLIDMDIGPAYPSDHCVLSAAVVVHDYHLPVAQR